jgi:hypothetical protein
MGGDRRGVCAVAMGERERADMSSMVVVSSLLAITQLSRCSLNGSGPVWVAIAGGCAVAMGARERADVTA